MLIRITHHCEMQCSHCMVEASPTGEHMAYSTFLSALSCLRRLDAPVIFLTGGEPTDHPEVIQFLKTAAMANKPVYLLSNGLFLADDAKRDAILPLVHGVQVTNDSRYYPRPIDQMPYPKVTYEDSIRQVSPFGRALTNNIPCNRMAPHCFNLRSLTRHYRSIETALTVLWGKGKFCTPSINVDGTVVAGEAPSCHPIGKVEDLPESLAHQVANMTCARCGLVNNLSHEEKFAVGESLIRPLGV